MVSLFRTIVLRGRDGNDVARSYSIRRFDSLSEAKANDWSEDGILQLVNDKEAEVERQRARYQLLEEMQILASDPRRI